MVLDFQKRFLHGFGKLGGNITGMQIANHLINITFQHTGKNFYGFLQSRRGAQVAHIAQMWRHIRQIIFDDAERIFKFTAHRQNRFFSGQRQTERQRRKSPRPAYHIRFIVMQTHNRIVRPQAYIPVVRKYGIAEYADFFDRIFFAPANRCAGNIAAGHHQYIGHFHTVGIFKKQHLQWRIRQHHPQGGITGSQFIRQSGIKVFIQQ